MPNKRTLGVMAGLAIGIGFTSLAHADILIHEGPVDEPPGFGAVAGSGEGPANAGGKTLDYTGLDLTQTENLYYGLANANADLWGPNGHSMDGPDISGSEIFRFSSLTASSIVYTGTTEVEHFNGSTWVTSPVDTRLTLSFTGSGSTVKDATTEALSSAEDGDVEALWEVQGDFTVNYLVEAKDPTTDVYGPANTVFDGLETPSGVQNGTSIDFGFYYELIPCNGDFDGDGDVDGSDLAIFSGEFGRTDCGPAAPCQGDFDGDGDVDGSDLALFSADFGRTDCPVEPL